MKKYAFIFIPILFFLCCKQNIKLVPEISPTISEENIFEFKDLNILKKIIKRDSEIIIITTDGYIYKFNPDKRKITLLFSLNSKIDPDLITQNGHLILKKQDSDAIILFNMDKMQIKKRLNNLNIKNIVGINDKTLVYKKKDGLVFLDYISSTELIKIKTYGDEIHNCEFSNNKTFILSNSRLYMYDQIKRTARSLKLKEKAASKFLLYDNHIYYGSENRKLIKLSLKSNKIKWQCKIPKTLKLKPQKIGRLIMILPEDNNIYFFNKNGTLYWWEKLESTKLFPPVAMKNNVCVFLMPKSKPNIKFFNYNDKKVHSYKLKNTRKSNPVYSNNYVYVVTRAKKDEFSSITKIGNRFDIDVKIEPEYIKTAGKSIKFELKSINLIDPEFKIEILDESRKKIFNMKLGKDDDPTFIWIPSMAGKYEITVHTNSLYKKDLMYKKKNKVINFKNILKK